MTRTASQRILNAVQHPEVYREFLIATPGGSAALSVWEGHRRWPVVVFLPGTMTHPLFYEEFLDALNRTGCTVIGLHPVGHGKSPRLPGWKLTWEGVVDSALSAVAWAQEQYADAPVVVIGSSQGGVLAMAVAARADGVAAVVAHNILDPALPATLRVTRLPEAWTPLYPRFRQALPQLARAVPWLPIPFDLYLDMTRVSTDPAVAEYFHTDPLGLRSYPLQLLAGMLAEDLPGPARCDVIVLAAAGDPLFSLAYTREVFDRIDAPHKELVVLDVGAHLIFNVAPDAVLEALIPRLRAHAPADTFC